MEIYYITKLGLFSQTKTRNKNMNTKYVIAAIAAIIIIIGSVAAITFLQQPAANVALNGAGATFPQPFLTATITAYAELE